jgi:hypothetical protein
VLFLLRNGRQIRKGLIFTSVAFIIAILPSCGGGSSSSGGGGGGGGGTTPGLYTVTVNAYTVSSTDAATPGNYVVQFDCEVVTVNRRSNGDGSLALSRDQRRFLWNRSKQPSLSNDSIKSTLSGFCRIRGFARNT